MRRLRFPSSRPLMAFAGLLAAFVLTGCPTDGSRDTFDYLRSAVNFRMDPVPADHPVCQDPATLARMTETECRNASKFRLRWDRPEDTVGFAEYRIYVDTTPPNSILPWSEVRTQRALASFVLEGTAPASDSIIFVLSDSGSIPNTLSRTSRGLHSLDTTGRLDASGRLVFAIAAGYREAGQDGLPGYTWVITNDRFAPYPLQPAFTPKAKSVTLDWERPRDATSFFEPEADSGIILAYYLRVVRGGILHANRFGNFDSVRVTYRVGGVDRTAEVVKTQFTGPRNAAALLFRLPDSMRVQNRNSASALDSLHVTLSGFTAQDTLDIGLWAVDTAGNVGRDSNLTKFTRILLTDTTQPTTPVLSLRSLGRNSFAYAFSASRDRVASGSSVVPAATVNANILEYRVSRTLTGGTGGSEQRDTVIQIATARRGDTAFTDTARHLPPGATYRLVVRAVDSTGHLSEPDTLIVSTLPARFPGADSLATCPPGFLAIPGGAFTLGDTGAASVTDEKPIARRTAPSYCIEAQEHKTTTGAFATRVTWQQAHDACRDLSQSLTPSDSTWLCTEAEWERACEGSLPDVPLVYGMQAEKRMASEVRYTCNIGTGDSAMALSSALRDPNCISYEGVLDMSGNLAEWVLDPYTSGGYPTTPDTLRRGTPHTAVTATSTRGFRGTHYLNPNQSPTVLLNRARCSNRDYASQARPRPYAGCVSTTGPLLVVTYNNALKPPRCLTLPDSIPVASIDSALPGRDSTQILLLLSGVPKPYVFKMPADTVYTGVGLKPVTAALTGRTLAIVTFRNSVTLESIVDTLHATELLGASTANQEAVFRREAATPWAAVKTGDVYQISYRYAHVQNRTTPAKAYYSNSALGYRCCSRPRP